MHHFEERRSELKQATTIDVEEEKPKSHGKRRNFWVLSFHQIVIRIGWIFKTESIVMPAVLDLLSGSGWYRSFLPALNRFGQSIPPVLLADRIRRLPRKTVALSLFSIGMAASFFAFSLFWFSGAFQTQVGPYLFLAIYTVFFIFKGMMDLAFGALQGKLVPPNFRGRLLIAASSLGALCAVFFAWLLLGAWLKDEGGRFDLIFGFTGLCFATGAIIVLLLDEPGDGSGLHANRRPRPIKDAIESLKLNRDFRYLVAIAFLFRRFDDTVPTLSGFGT